MAEAMLLETLRQFVGYLQAALVILLIKEIFGLVGGGDSGLKGTGNSLGNTWAKMWGGEEGVEKRERKIEEKDANLARELTQLSAQKEGLDTAEQNLELYRSRENQNEIQRVDYLENAIRELASLNAQLQRVAQAGGTGNQEFKEIYVKAKTIEKAIMAQVNALITTARDKRAKLNANLNKTRLENRSARIMRQLDNYGLRDVNTLAKLDQQIKNKSVKLKGSKLKKTSRTDFTVLNSDLNKLRNAINSEVQMMNTEGKEIQEELNLLNIISSAVKRRRMQDMVQPIIQLKVVLQNEQKMILNEERVNQYEKQFEENIKQFSLNIGKMDNVLERVSTAEIKQADQNRKKASGIGR
jgi:hypothetical protein